MFLQGEYVLLPRQKDDQAGRTFACEMKGIVVYLNKEEYTRIQLAQYGFYGALLMGVAMISWARAVGDPGTRRD